MPWSLSAVAGARSAGARSGSLLELRRAAISATLREDQPPASGLSALGPLRILLRRGVRIGEIFFVLIADHDLDGEALVLELLHVVGVFHRLLENVAQLGDERRRHPLRAGDPARRARDHRGKTELLHGRYVG